MRIVLTLNGVTINVMMTKTTAELCDYDHDTNIVQLNEGHPYVRHLAELPQDEGEPALLVIAACFVAVHIRYCAECLERMDMDLDHPDETYD